MVMTVLEGIVAEDKRAQLIEIFQKALQHVPPEILSTYLVHDTKNPELFRIMSIWKSKEDLAAMRQKGTPEGVLMFRAVGAEPTLSLYDIDAKANG